MNGSQTGRIRGEDIDCLKMKSEVLGRSCGGGKPFRRDPVQSDREKTDKGVVRGRYKLRCVTLRNE